MKKMIRIYNALLVFSLGLAATVHCWADNSASTNSTDKSVETPISDGTQCEYGVNYLLREPDEVGVIGSLMYGVKPSLPLIKKKKEIKSIKSDNINSDKKHKENKTD